MHERLLHALVGPCVRWAAGRLGGCLIALHVPFCSLAASASNQKALDSVGMSALVNRAFLIESQGVWHHICRYTAHALLEEARG